MGRRDEWVVSNKAWLPASHQARAAQHARRISSTLAAPNARSSHLPHPGPFCSRPNTSVFPCASLYHPALRGISRGRTSAADVAFVPLLPVQQHELSSIFIACQHSIFASRTAAPLCLFQGACNCSRRILVSGSAVAVVCRGPLHAFCMHSVRCTLACTPPLDPRSGMHCPPPTLGTSTPSLPRPSDAVRFVRTAPRWRRAPPLLLSSRGPSTAQFDSPMYQQGGFQPPGGFGGPPGGFGGPSGAPPFGGHAPAPYHGGGQPERQQDDRYAGKGAKDPVLAVSR